MGLMTTHCEYFYRAVRREIRKGHILARMLVASPRVRIDLYGT